MNQSIDEKPVTNVSRDDKQSLITRIMSVLLPLLAKLGIPQAKKAQAKLDQAKQEAQAELNRKAQEAQAEGDRIAQETKDRLKTPAEDTA